MIRDSDVTFHLTAESKGVREGVAQAKQEIGGLTTDTSAKGKVLSGFFLGIGMEAAKFVKDSAGAIFNFFKESVQEAANAEKSVSGLKHALGNLGVAYGDVEKPINRVIDGLAKTSRFSDDELRDSFTNLVRTTGDVNGSMKNLSVVADLAVAKNLSLEQASNIVGKAMEGNNTALQKLFPSLKGSTDAVGDLGKMLKGTAEADAATFSGRLSNLFKQFGEVKEAIGGVVTGGGIFNRVLAGATDIMIGLAKWIGENTAKFQAFFGAVGGIVEVFLDIGRAIFETLRPGFEYIGKVAGEGGLFAKLLGVIGEIGAGFKGFAGAAITAFGLIEAALGAFVEKAGKVLSVFGIDVVEGYGTMLKRVSESALEQGAKLIEEAKAQHERSATQIRTGKLAAEAQLLRDTKKSQGDQTAAAGAGAAARADLAAKEAEKIRAIREKADRETVKSIEATAKALDEILKREAKETAEQVEAVGKAFHLTFGPTTRDMMTQSRAEIMVMAEVAEKLYRQKKLTKEQIEQIRHETARWKTTLLETVTVEDDLAQSAKDAEEWFKKQRERKQELVAKQRESVEAMANTARTALDFGQAMGLVDDRTANVLNSVINIGSNFAKILQGDLAGGITGVLGGLANLIGNWGSSAAEKERKRIMEINTRALQENTDALSLTSTGRTMQGVGAAIGDTLRSGPEGSKRRFLELLAAQGVSMKDAEALFEQFGLGEGFKSGDDRAFAHTLQTLQQKMAQTPIKAGQGWADQIQVAMDRLRLQGAGDDETLQQLALLTTSTSGSPLLQQIFGRDLGTRIFTGAGREKLLGELFGVLDALGPQGAGLSAEQLGGLTPRELIAFITQVIPLLQKSTLEFGLPGPIPGDKSGFGAGLSGMLGGLALSPSLTSGMGMPGLSWAPPNLSWAAPDLAGVAGAGLTSTVVNGGINFNVTIPEQASPQEAARIIIDELDALLEFRRIQAIAATGAATI